MTDGAVLDAPRPGDAARALEVLRILLGGIWAANLLFIVLPAAQYWSTFSAVALSYGSTTPGGPGFAQYVSDHSLFFAWLIAIASAYLAVAFLLGLTTRLACAVGFFASIVFFWTQYTMTFDFPGGTDVGAHPLYLVIYVALFFGGAGRYWSVDARIWPRAGRALRTVGRWVAAPSR